MHSLEHNFFLFFFFFRFYLKVDEGRWTSNKDGAAALVTRIIGDLIRDHAVYCGSSHANFLLGQRFTALPLPQNEVQLRLACERY